MKRCWQHGKRIFAELEGVCNIESATSLKGAKVWVSSTEVEISKDEYLWEDLIGCIVIDESSSQALGTVIALEEYGAQDILIVRTPDDDAQPGEWSLPFVENVVCDIHIGDRIITVRLPEGMEACFTPKS